MSTVIAKPALRVVILTATLGLLAAPSAQALERATSYSYTALGQVASIDGPRPDVADITTYDYDSQGNRIRITNALGHVTQITAHDASGRPLISIDPNGLVTEVAYDARGRLVRIDRGGEVTTLQYDAAGNLIETVRPDGTVVRMDYDSANRLIGVEDAEGNRIAYTLDAAGNRTRVEVHDSSGQLVGLQRHLFDELSRTLETLGAAGQSTRYQYDANDNRTGTVDANGHATSHAYDALNRLVHTTDPLGGITAYGFDAQDNLTAVTDPNGNTTTYEYDGLGNLIAQHSPDTGTTTYSHDAAGNVLSKTDAKGQTTTYQYDALNRLVHTLYADGSEVTYTYDTADNGIGRLARVSDRSGTTDWQYDRHGRTVQRTQTLELDGHLTELTTRYQYNAVGQLIGLTYPSGLQVDYHYAHGKISGLDLNGTPLLSAISYRPFGPVTGWQWGNGSLASRGYDLDGRLISQRLGEANRSLDYDPAGNITAISEPDDTQTFNYDPLNRLSQAAANDFNQSWSYDANGNRLSQSEPEATTAYSLEAGSNRLLAVDESVYSYDANGNLIEDGEHRYRYDATNRLVAIDEGELADYRYNALGQRVYKNAKTGQDYAALAQAQRELAADYRAQAEALVPTLTALNRTIGQLRGELKRTERAAARATRHAERLARQQTHQAKQVAALRERVSALQAEYEAQQAKLAEPARGFWQRLRRHVTRWYSRYLAWRLEWAEQQLARADARLSTLAEQAEAAQSEAATLAVQVESLQQELTQAQAEQQATKAQLRTLREQAAEAMQRAAEYQHQAEQGGTPYRQTLFAYDSWRLLGEYSAGGGVKQETVWLGNLPVATIRQGQTYYIHADHLGTPRVLTDASNTEVWRWDSDPFGTTEAEEDPDGDNRRVRYNLRFPGQYYDVETGRHYNYFRDYDPSTGRYIESDPIGLDGGANTYVYVEGEPVNWLDPLGLQSRAETRRERNKKYGARKPNQGPLGYSAGIGGCSATTCVDYNAKDGESSVTIPLTPTIGGGFSFCMENRGNGNSSCSTSASSDRGVSSTSIGLGKYLGVSVSNKRTCINIGLSLGLPANVYFQAGTIK